MNNHFEKEHNQKIIKSHFDFINRFFFDDIKDRVTYIAESDNRILTIFLKELNYFSKIGSIQGITNKQNNDIEYICSIFGFYSLFSNEEVKESVKNVYRNIIDLNYEICKGLFSEYNEIQLKIDLALDENSKLSICIENNMRRFSKDFFVVTAYCNKDYFFNENYWKKVLFRLYRLENFMTFEDFKHMKLENISQHLKLMSY